MSEKAADVIVIGAGLAGLSAAWYLQAAGYRVAVVERREDVALETSYANAGMATPSMSEPWNAPGVHWEILRSIGRPHSGLLLRLGAFWRYIDWGLRFLGNSAAQRFEAAAHANFELSAFSIHKIRELQQRLSIDCDARQAGTLKIFRSQAAFDAAVLAHDRLANWGLRYTALSPQATRQLEPILSESPLPLVGGLHNLDDDTADARRFCLGLKNGLASAGVPIHLETGVDRILTERGAVSGIATSKGPFQCSQVVVSAAGWSAPLLKPHGVRFPIQPVKGYSLTLPVKDPGRLPGRSIIDDALHGAITPFDDRLRVAGTAELAGWDRRLHPERLQNLWDMVQQITPGILNACDRNEAESWCGFRPMSPDGVPYIGATAVQGLYLNSGHGYLGWTQSAGSGYLLTQLMQGHRPDIDMRPYDARRG